MSTDDRLSALPDSVLGRILSTLHLKAAVQTSLLSKRWRTVWRETDGVNLDTRPYADSDTDYDGAKVGRQFFRDTMAAIVGAEGRCLVRRLSFRADSYFQGDFPEAIMRTTSPGGMDALLAAPAMRRLEELSMELTADFCQAYVLYALPAGLLRGTSLRVLDITGCTLAGGGGGGGGFRFSCQETLRMVLCFTSSETLQSMLDAAPNLSTLWLEQVDFPSSSSETSTRRRILLRCPSATVSVTMMHCRRCSWTEDGVDLDAPGARTLRYAGCLENFPLSSSSATLPANLQHMELCFRTSQRYTSSSVAEPHAIFWGSIIGRFSTLRFLQLEIPDISDIAVRPVEQEGAFLKVMFTDLRFLELKGCYKKDSHGEAVAMANLLRCCPSMQEFCLKCDLPGDEPYAFHRRLMIRQNSKTRAQVDLENSIIEAFIKRIIKSEDDDHDVELGALKARSFHCLDHHLKKVRLEFEVESFNCFGIKLARFFVENAAVLEEMEVYDGYQTVYDHIHHKLAE